MKIVASGFRSSMQNLFLGGSNTLSDEATLALFAVHGVASGSVDLWHENKQKDCHRDHENDKDQRQVPEVVGKPTQRERFGDDFEAK
mmetsp:Transcript_2336/g.5799  ORF Transcript_2336/g.5799 Transcript_2336/m.5799 type:complete len:87 (-) Transcript_2336:2042-2302(-)